MKPNVKDGRGCFQMNNHSGSFVLVVASSFKPYILYVCHDKTGWMKIIGILSLEMSPGRRRARVHWGEDDTKNDAGFCPEPREFNARKFPWLIFEHHCDGLAFVLWFKLISALEPWQAWSWEKWPSKVDARYTPIILLKRFFFSMCSTPKLNFEVVQLMRGRKLCNTFYASSRK